MPKRRVAGNGLGIVLLTVLVAGGGEPPSPGTPRTGEPIRTNAGAKKVDIKGKTTREIVAELIPADVIDALNNPEEFTLFSLDPEEEGVKRTTGKFDPADKREKVRDWTILGRVEVNDPADRHRLVGALWEGVAANDGTRAMCFNPRHAIRVKLLGKTLDFVICFECLQVQVTEGRRRGNFLTTAVPQATFDKFLKEAKVPLPEPARN